jgi:hypothetical protein
VLVVPVAVVVHSIAVHDDGGGSGAVVGVAGVVEIVIAVVVVAAADGDYGGGFPNRHPFGPNGFRHRWDKTGIKERCVRRF